MVSISTVLAENRAKNQEAPPQMNECLCCGCVERQMPANMFTI